jgi:hypothetical protein
MFQTAYDAGIRRFQANNADRIINWCLAQPG